MWMRHWCIGALVLTAGCGSDDDRLVVFGAASLTDALADIEAAFEADHPDVDVVVSVGGSSSLVAQINGGAPVDVILTADERTMERLADLLVAAPVVFATNQMVLAVEPGNPLGITGLDDLAARDDAVVVLAAPDVPAGAYAAELIDCAGVRLDPSSLEQSVRSAASKVRLGEADAALVYRTDVAGLDTVELPSECQVVAGYPLGRLNDSPRGEAFESFVLGDVGQQILVDVGFGTP